MANTNAGPAISSFVNEVPLRGTFDQNSQLIQILGPGQSVALDPSTLSTSVSLAAQSGAGLVGLGQGTVQDVLGKANLSLGPVAQPATCLATAGTAGVLTGTYIYAVSFVTANGETEISGSTSVTVSAQQVNLTNVTLGTDSRVIARRIYRTIATPADVVLRNLVVTINDNTTTVFVDNVPDGSLGVPAPRINTTGGLINVGGQRIGAAGNGTTVFGVLAHTNNTGYSNTAIGSRALQVNTFGYRNSAVGNYALSSNTTGANNTATGVHALNNSVVGMDNTAVGYGAAFSSQENSNTAVGSYALYQATGGSSNTAIGANAMQLAATGGLNTAVGAQASYNLSTGIRNTAVGYQVALAATSGNFNASFGERAAGSCTTGSTNTAIGGTALFYNITGSGNVALGSGAGTFETGDNNLWIDNSGRASRADALANSLIYGQFGANASAQRLIINGLTFFPAGQAVNIRVIANADYTQLFSDSVIVCNGSAPINLTLLSGPLHPGRLLTIKNVTAFAVNSSSANIIPLAAIAGPPTTAILSAGPGKWAQLQYDGTNWLVIMGN